MALVYLLFATSTTCQPKCYISQTVSTKLLKNGRKFTTPVPVSGEVTAGFEPGPLMRSVQIRLEMFGKRWGGRCPIPLILLPLYSAATLVVHPSQPFWLWAKLLQLTDHSIFEFEWLPVTEFKFKLQHISTTMTTVRCDHCDDHYSLPGV